jgi:hypothetical protein
MAGENNLPANGAAKNGTKAKAKKKKPSRPTKDRVPQSGARTAAKYSALQEATTMHSDYVHHLIDPETTDAMRVPDGITATSAIFKTPTVKVVGAGGTWDSANAISSATTRDGAGESIVGVFPGVAGSIWITSGNDHTIVPTDDGFGLLTYETCVGLIDPAPPAETQWARHAIMDCQHAILPRYSTGETAWVYEIEAHTDLLATSLFNVACTFVPRDGTELRGMAGLNFTLNSRQAGVWSTVTSSTLPSPGGGGNNTAFISQTVVAPDFINAFSVSVTSSEDNHTLDGSLIIKIVAKPVSDPTLHCRIVMPEYSSMHFTVDSWADLNSLTATSAERVTALSCLLTYMGSSLQNGGVIAGGRLATGLTIQDAPDGDIYSYLAGLPFYAADYPLKDGAYAWWAPDSQEEQFFTPYNEPPMSTRNLTSLWFAANRDDISQTLRARIVMGLETITRARTYNARIGPVNPNYPLLLALAKTLPAVTENPGHGILGNIWGGFKDLIGKRSTWDDITNWGLDSIFG